MFISSSIVIINKFALLRKKSSKIPKGVTRIRKSKNRKQTQWPKDKVQKKKKKKRNNDPTNTAQKTDDRATRISLKTVGVNSGAPEG